MTILLCLSFLTGCGSNKYEELITMLDEGNYTQAVDYINNLAYEAAKDNGTVDSKSNHINYLYGSWEYAGSSTDQETYDITFNDNGTCTVNGEQYLWNIQGEQDTWMNIEILEGASKAYHFELTYPSDTGFYHGYFSIYNKEAESFNGLGYYRNLDHYEVIDLTVDNWEDFFEIYSCTKFHQDSFGDTTSCSYHEYYKLKDEYESRLNYNYNNSKIAYEYKYENGRMVVNYNLEEETFELVEFILNESYPENTTTGTMGIHSLNSNDYFYGFSIMGGSTPSNDNDKKVLYNYHNNPTMVRIQGQLMLWKGLD